MASHRVLLDEMVGTGQYLTEDLSSVKHFFKCWSYKSIDDILEMDIKAYGRPLPAALLFGRAKSTRGRLKV
jgi:hypothetical protein